MLSVSSQRSSLLRNTLWVVLISIAIAIATLASLTACSGSPWVGASIPTLDTASPLATQPASLTDWHSAWLSGTPCRPPCWQDITPGVTTVSDAIEKLKNTSFISGVHTVSGKLTPDYGDVVWSWIDGSYGGLIGFDTQASTQTVYFVSPQFSVTFRLEDVIAAYGNPEYVFASAFRNPDIGSGISYQVSIIYFSIGLRLRTSGLTKPVLNSATPFDEVIFFDPGSEKFKISRDILVPWEGIKDFDFYCRDGRGGQVCGGTP